MKTKPKIFDAVAMKRRGAQRIHEELAQLDRDGQRAYWQLANRELQERQAAVRRPREAGEQPPAR
jgi:hypothetical protein